jgi:hypothetical protein
LRFLSLGVRTATKPGPCQLDQACNTPGPTAEPKSLLAASVEVNSAMQSILQGPTPARVSNPSISDEEVIALGRMKSFCAKILKALAPPLLKEVQVASSLRPDAEPFTPRRSARFTRSNASNTEQQPQESFSGRDRFAESPWDHPIRVGGGRACAVGIPTVL